MYHDAMYPMLLRYPGITVLHDYGLYRFITTRTIPQGNFAGYVREMGYALGVKGVHLAYQVRRGQREHPFYKVPLNDRVLDSSVGIIAHNQYTRRRIQAQRPYLPVSVIPAPIQDFRGPLLSRQDLGCPGDALVFVSAGQVTDHKQVSLTLEAFAQLRADFPRALYVIVGEEIKHSLDLKAYFQQRGLQDAVICTDYVHDMQEFVSWIAAADVLINLRYPTIGETSATALRGLVAGRPVIVSDRGWYAELPDDVCVKIPPNDVDALLAAMRQLAGDEALRREIGCRAAEYAQREHNLARAARMYLAFVNEILAGATGELKTTLGTGVRDA
jgi:glycosyltransferase involved in cell wall biosynthesis